MATIPLHTPPRVHILSPVEGVFTVWCTACDYTTDAATHARADRLATDHATAWPTACNLHRAARLAVPERPADALRIRDLRLALHPPEPDPELPLDPPEVTP